MKTQWEKQTRRARSNVRASARRIGVVGVIDQLRTAMYEGAMAHQPGTEGRAHYAKLEQILAEANERFRAECGRYDAVQEGMAAA